MKTLWKFLRLKDGKIVSEYGNVEWKIGEWKKEEDVKLCESGFHGSKTILDALSFVKGEVLAKVEVKGKSDKKKDKEAWSEMRVVEAYEWTKKDSVALSIFSAELCIKNFEKKFPEDKRPREAIEAAKKWLAEPSKENEAAARSAWSAAESAARSAWSAESAEYDKLLHLTLRKINKWLLSHVEDMKKYE